MKKKFKSTRPPSNPLNPVYRLPYCEKVAPVVNNFIRDAIDTSDIESALLNQKASLGSSFLKNPEKNLNI